MDQQRIGPLVRVGVVLLWIGVLAGPCGAQANPPGERTWKPATPQSGKPATPPVAKPPQAPWTEELNKYPGLAEEFGTLFKKLQANVHFPPGRSQSRLLPLLPEDTLFYAALPNYGDAVGQALTIFRDELQKSAVLRDWYSHGDVAKTGPEIEKVLENLRDVSAYMGNEVVIAGGVRGKKPSVVLITEAKPGLKLVLQRTLDELARTSHQPKASFRILDPQELAVAQPSSRDEQFVVLVRPGFLMAGGDVATLREVSARLDRSSTEFASTAFGQRIAQAYDGGMAMVGGVDLHAFLKEFPSPPPQSAMFERSGFADMKYAIWQQKSGTWESQTELSFLGPRHGIASWLAAPTSLGTLSFVSPHPLLAAAFALKDPVQILDDAQALSPDAKGFAGLTQMERALDIDLRRDVLRYLTGELTIELDRFTPPTPAWRVMLRVTDPVHLQQTLQKFLVQNQMETRTLADAGLAYYTVRPKSPQGAPILSYAFVDGYLVAASTQESLAEAVRLHRTGGSLASSEKLRAALPAGHGAGASGVWVQDPFAMMALQAGSMPPGVAGQVRQLAEAAGTMPPTVVAFYGEPTAIQQVSSAPGANAASIMIVAAIAIPNLLRSRMAANEASAVGSLRTVNTAQVTYATTYPQLGFSRDLASLGSASGAGVPSPAHAGLIDTSLAGPSCTASSWCEKSGYRFRLAACKQTPCRSYVSVAKPASSSTGQRSFCSTEDGVIRTKIVPEPELPATPSQCRAWQPLH